MADILIFKSGQKHVGGSFFHPLLRTHHTSPSAKNHSRCQANVRVRRLIAVSCPKTDSSRHHRVAAYSTCSLRTHCIGFLPPAFAYCCQHLPCLSSPLLLHFLKYFISMTRQFFASDFAIGVVCGGYVHVHACACVCVCVYRHAHMQVGDQEDCRLSPFISLDPVDLFSFIYFYFVHMDLHMHVTMQVLRTVCGDWFFPSTT